MIKTIKQFIEERKELKRRKRNKKDIWVKQTPVSEGKKGYMKRFKHDFIPSDCSRLFLPIVCIIYLMAVIGYAVYFVFYWIIYALKWLFGKDKQDDQIFLVFMKLQNRI